MALAADSAMAAQPGKRHGAIVPGLTYDDARKA